MAVLEGVDRTAAPRRDRDADLLGDQLGADLVPELAHRLGARADEGDADPGAQLGEGRVLGDEAPAHPGRVRAGLDQRPLQHRVGPGTAAPRRARGRRRGRPRARTSPRARPRCTARRLDRAPSGLGSGVQVSHGVDQPHRGLTTVDDGDARERAAAGDVRNTGHPVRLASVEGYARVTSPRIPKRMRTRTAPGGMIDPGTPPERTTMERRMTRRGRARPAHLRGPACRPAPAVPGARPASGRRRRRAVCTTPR